jgi:hypothetical protein
VSVSILFEHDDKGVNMTSNERRAILPFLILMGVCLCGLGAQPVRWFKGNTHTHTTNSDGNELPRRVVRWYQDNNYNFVVLTDHGIRTEIRTLDTDPNDDFLVIAGEEVTDSFENRPAHLCAINPDSVVDARHGKSMTDTLQNDVDAIRAVGGLPQINHPNWRWSFTDREMAPLKEVRLFEVYNFNKDCNNFAAGGYAGMEEIWDRLLSRGLVFFGVASDDTHSYLGDFLPQKASPGKGWVMVRAGELTPTAVVRALESGDFYSTCGVLLDDVRADDHQYVVKIQPQGTAKYTTFFIGREGKILKADHNLVATYTCRGDELYVRARVVCSTGDFAVTQPFFLKK